MKRNYTTALLIALLLLMESCALLGHPREVVPKPRYHHTWYKNHIYHKKLHIGRLRIKIMEKQGTRKVRMSD
ncbi:MAG: hypothetical protein K1X47_09880 [Cyclobacteriaceae bacterium]|nr:hypothetical protein [Cyclobacteriaceae bacterium]